MVESWDWLIQLVEAGSFTRAGEAFLSYAYEQNEALSCMLRRIGETTVGGTGLLKVGVSHFRSRLLMPHVIQQFHRSMPGVSVKIFEGTNEELVHLAEQGGVDLAIARFGGTHPGVSVRPLFEEEIVFAITPSLLEAVTGLEAGEAVASLEEKGLGLLKDCPLLLTSLDDVTGRVAQTELRGARIKPNVVVESESMMTLLPLCAAGIGGVFCPTNILDAEDDYAGGLLRVRLSDAARYAISIGRQANAEPWTPAQLFEDIVGALFGEDHAVQVTYNFLRTLTAE